MDNKIVLNAPDIKALNDKIYIQSAFLNDLTSELSKVLVGQQMMTDRLLIGLLTQGHILLEGVPGLAKTLAIKSLAQTIDADFKRIQFTPDLLPADIIGTQIYNPIEHKFEVRKGPVFTNFLLADEINRAPAKVQSALLEAMQEKQVTIGENTFRLEEPFLVLATQNPIEQEGTYNLPEAQVDRFLLKVVILYPTRQDERLIIRNQLSQQPYTIKPVVRQEQILEARKLVRDIYMDEKIEKYILDIVFSTRFPKDHNLEKLTQLISFGASPRASISLGIAAKAHAFLNRRGFVIPEDIRAICHDVLRHRIGVSYEAEAENITSELIIDEILNGVEVP